MEPGAEEEFLNQIASYRRRYNTLYPRGPLLLLTPLNEEERMVSVVSLVVPSRVPHPQLLNLQEATSVLADLITYTPPSPPPSLPRKVRSPAVVVDGQSGSGCECALVVASVLLGSGYGAFVVQGAALPRLVARDTSHLPCPYLVQEETEDVAKKEKEPSKYSVRPPPDLRSRYLLIMQERERRQQQQKQQEAQEDTCHTQQKAPGLSNVSSESESHLHFWVLVLPPEREITTPVFVEPTTGQVTPLDSAQTMPYSRIHAVFDHTNYWACVRYDEPIRHDMFDLSERSVWLPLIEEGGTSSSALLKQGAQYSSRQQEQEESEVEPPIQHGISEEPRLKNPTLQTQRRAKDVIKVPKTWARPIIITKEALEQRFPRGWREEKYRRVTVRRYSPFSHPRGATLVLTLYTDEGSAKVVRERFEQRRDGLVGRETDLQSGCVVETFAKTRKDTLKRHQYWRPPSCLTSRATLAGMDNPSEAQEEAGDQNDSAPGEEVFKFQSKSRVDALRSRVIGGTVWREEFDQRPDLLLTRSVTFSSSDTAQNRTILRIEEEFGCPEDVEPHTAVQRRAFLLSERRILLVYHYGRHRLLQPTRSFMKPPNGQEATSLTPEMTHGFQPDPSVEETGMPQLWAVLQAEMEAEVSVQEEVRRGVEETAALREARISEERNTVLLPHIFDIQRNEIVQYILKQRKYEEANREETRRKRREEREGKVDTIAPYLPLLLGESEDKARGETVRERCLEDLRERLALRANLLQDRLDQARATVLECREEGSRRKRLSVEERADLTSRTAAAETAHRRLRAQLAAWRHEASERYEALAARLEADPRLEVDSKMDQKSGQTTPANATTPSVPTTDNPRTP